MLVNKTTVAVLVAVLVIVQLLATPRAGVAEHQDPAPPLTWQDWHLVGNCGGVDIFAAISADDGRNDIELKVKLDNKNTYTIQTRLSAVVESAEGQKTSRENIGIGRLNSKRAVDACSIAPSLCLGVLFPSAVFQKEPTHIRKMILTKVEVANIDAPPANASPGTYLDPFRDFPTTSCRDLSVTFPSGSSPAFVKLTDSCVKALPRWTKPDCDDAVDQIVKAYKGATSEAHQNCISEWRSYQKCYEVYAYDSNPVPRPSCKRPVCKLKG